MKNFAVSQKSKVLKWMLKNVTNYQLQAFKKKEMKTIIMPQIFFSRAQLADSTNQNVYYNFGKIHIGLGNIEEVIKNFLVYLHLSIYNNVSMDPITGDRLFNNVLEFDCNDSIKQNFL